jgi:hypothetical protein
VRKFSGARGVIWAIRERAKVEGGSDRRRGAPVIGAQDKKSFGDSLRGRRHVPIPSFRPPWIESCASRLSEPLALDVINWTNSVCAGFRRHVSLRAYPDFKGLENTAIAWWMWNRPAWFPSSGLALRGDEPRADYLAMVMEGPARGDGPL